MRTPSHPVVRKTAKGAVMAGTAALAALAVGTLVKRRISTPDADQGRPPREETE